MCSFLMACDISGAETMMSHSDVKYYLFKMTVGYMYIYLTREYNVLMYRFNYMSFTTLGDNPDVN